MLKYEKKMREKQAKREHIVEYNADALKASPKSERATLQPREGRRK